MTPDDRARLEAVAAQCERMGIDDLRTVPVDDPWALAAAIRAALAERDELRRWRETQQSALLAMAVELINGGYKGDGVVEGMKYLRQRIADLEAERDRLDCTRREGGDTRHCRVDAKCLRCRYEALEAEHVNARRTICVHLSPDGQHSSVEPARAKGVH